MDERDMVDHARRLERYTRLVRWAKRRYADLDDPLTYTTSHGHLPSRYSVIEDMAAARYLRCIRRFPGWTLALAATRIEPLDEQRRRAAAAAA